MVLSILPCPDGSCPNAGEDLGTILSVGPFQPVGQPPEQTFNITVPDAFPGGYAELVATHFVLRGVSHLVPSRWVAAWRESRALTSRRRTSMRRFCRLPARLSLWCEAGCALRLGIRVRPWLPVPDHVHLVTFRAWSFFDFVYKFKGRETLVDWQLGQYASHRRESIRHHHGVELGFKQLNWILHVNYLVTYIMKTYYIHIPTPKSIPVTSRLYAVFPFFSKCEVSGMPSASATVVGPFPATLPCLATLCRCTHVSLGLHFVDFLADLTSV